MINRVIQFALRIYRKLPMPEPLRRRLSILSQRIFRPRSAPAMPEPAKTKMYEQYTKQVLAIPDKTDEYV